MWHAMAHIWQVILSWWMYTVGQQIRGVACHGTELAHNSLTVAVLGRRGKVIVWHAMAQIWQVILSRWLYSVVEARSLCGVACHGTDLSGNSLMVEVLCRTANSGCGMPWHRTGT